MGFFTSYFRQKRNKHIYLAGWEAEFNGNEQCQKFLKTQVVNKKTAENIWSSIELVFRDDKLIKVYDIDNGSKTERKLKENEIGFEFQKLKPNQIYILKKALKSESYLGGEIPNEFNIPKFKFNAPFQYLGKLSKSDNAFEWLPFDLHLVAPIYLNIDKLFIDYSNSLNPKVLNIDELKQTDNSYDDLQPNSEIVYEKVHIITEKSNNLGLGIGHSGIPNWIQYPDIPTCPVSNKTMKFLCQLTYDGLDVKTKRTNISPKDEWFKQYFENMNFWGDGDLYIFFEPKSKVACFLIQNT